MTKLKVLTRIRHDGKIYKAGELLELEDENTIKRLLDHEAVEIIEGPVETENKKVDTNPLNNENLGDGNINPLDNENPDGGNNEGNAEDGEITLEDLLKMTEEEIDKLADANNIELKCKKQETKAQELFDKLGEE